MVGSLPSSGPAPMSTTMEMVNSRVIGRIAAYCAPDVRSTAIRKNGRQGSGSGLGE